MFHPVEGTLGYSHSLILYAPMYIPLRPALHPFQAFSLTLFAVMLGGSVALYVVLRRAIGIGVGEAVALTAFFVTSPKVLNGWIGVWSQRASVCLIPPILLLLAAAMRMREGGRRTAFAGTAGFLAALLFTHDFYTPVLAAIVTVLLAPAVAGGGLSRIRHRLSMDPRARLPRTSWIRLPAGAEVWRGCLGST